jgi:glutathione S-transferase
VPVLKHGEITVWDSLAICEYLAERFPEKKLWPADRQARAVARSISAEMHSGFAALRTHMSMNIRRALPGRGRTPESLADVARIVASWEDCRRRFGGDGPLLFGHFTVADAMYAPVALRFQTYAVDLSPAARAYADALRALPAMQEWTAAARAETEVIEAFEPESAV